MKNTENSTSRQPRLLVVGPLPPPVGGVETVTRAVLDSQALGQFNVVHCNTTKGRPKQTQGKFDLGNLWWALKHFVRMWKCCYSFRPHAVYMPVTATWSGFWRDAVLATIAKYFDAKVIGHVHGAWFDRILASHGVTQRLVRLSLTRYDALLMLGKVWKQMVQEYGYSGHVFVVPSTLRKELYERGNQFERIYQKNSPVGLFVGQVGHRKGVFDILSALQKLKQSGQAARIVFVGPGEDEGEWEALMQRRAELHVEDVADFVGPLEGEELYDKFRSTDYLVLPSYSEGLPVVFFEAGAFGMPVIGTPVGAIPDLLVHEINAILVEPGDVTGLAGAIYHLRTNENERARLGAQLRKSITAYHPDRIGERIAEAIEMTLSDAGLKGKDSNPVS